MKTVSLKSMLIPYVSLRTNLRKEDSDVEELKWVHVTVSAPYSATTSLRAPDGRYENFDTTFHRSSEESGHDFRRRVTRTLDVFSAMFVLGRGRQQKDIQSALGICGDRTGAYLKGELK